MNRKEYYENCEKCGRPWRAPNKPSCGCSQNHSTSEYCGKKPGCIRKKKPGCVSACVIPSVTVDSVSGIRNLRDCFVYVTSLNTTFYIDDKGRPMITWAGPVEIADYDYQTNPDNLRAQMLFTNSGSQNLMIYFDKSGQAQVMNSGGSITVDDELSTTSENPVQNKVITNALGNKQDTLTAGANIIIENNVISATGGGGGGSYIAGDGITITGNIISAKAKEFTTPEWQALWV